MDKPSPSIYAAIDIGSNTILMTTAMPTSLLDTREDTHEGTREDTRKASHSSKGFVLQSWQHPEFTFKDYINFARLAEGLNETGYIAKDSLARAIRIMEEYKSILEAMQSALPTQKTSLPAILEIRACATSAMREAKNGPSVAARLSAVLGSGKLGNGKLGSGKLGSGKLEIISAAREAELAFLGAASELTGKAVLLDIGGGSVEIAYGKQGRLEHSVSLPIGALRWKNKYPHALLRHPAAAQQLRKEVAAIFHSHIKQPKHSAGMQFLNQSAGMQLLGVAGAPTTLAAVQLKIANDSFPAIHMKTLSLKNIQRIIKMFQSHASHELRHSAHTALNFIDENRSPIILLSSLILEELMRLLGKDEIIVSIKGLRYGLLEEMLAKKEKAENN